MENPSKLAVVTGISSGIGLALTKKLLAEHYTVIGTTRSGKLPDFAHPNLHLVAFDATDRQSSVNTVARIQGLSREIDLLVNNAGSAPDVFAVEPEYDSFTQTLTTNVTGVVFFTEPLLSLLRQGGQVVFISSSMGLLRNAAPTGPGYRLSKAAINMYAAMLATRVADKHVRVTPIHPGWVRTRLGGDQAPVTAEQAADNIYLAITTNTETGKFWDTTLPGIDQF